MKRKRKTAVLLAAFLLLVFPIKVTAAQVDPYVLIYPLVEATDQKPYSYVTPFTVQHTAACSDGTCFFSGSCAPQIFQLHDSENASIIAYCADPAAEIVPGAKYRRINLEDSTYFSDLTAGKLRAVIQHAFPVLEVETIQENANIWLKERELPEIQALQSGEAILAAQIAVWKLAGGASYTVHSLYGGVVDLSGYQDQVVHTGELIQKPTEFTGRNIESLYTFFCNLPPEPSVTALVSEESITRTVYTCTQSPEGYFTADISATVNVERREMDTLTIIASCGDEVQEQAVTEAGEYRFVFSELPQRMTVRLEIQGYQYGEDVFLLDAEGERESSQTLITYDRGMQPVYCERILTPIPSAASAIPTISENLEAKEETRENKCSKLETVTTIQVMAGIVVSIACLLVLGNHKKIV